MTDITSDELQYLLKGTRHSARQELLDEIIKMCDGHLATAHRYLVQRPDLDPELVRKINYGSDMVSTLKDRIVALKENV